MYLCKIDKQRPRLYFVHLTVLPVAGNVVCMRLSPGRFYQSSKSSGLSSTLQPAGAKAEHHREEMEEAANRMEICRVSPRPRSVFPPPTISPYTHQRGNLIQ